jgi:hypothetical protein
MDAVHQRFHLLAVKDCGLFSDYLQIADYLLLKVVVLWMEKLIPVILW